MRFPFRHGAKVRSAAISALCALLLTACGANPESMLASAKEYLAKNDTNAATIQLKNALQKNPSLAEARYLLGKVHFQQGNYADAEKELKRALDLGFSPDQVVPVLAESLLFSGQGVRVLTELHDQKLSQAEARASLLATVGLAQMTQGKRDEAVQAFEGALKEFPGYPQARVGLARVKASGRDLQGALADVDAVIKDAPKLPEAHALRGELLLGLNRPEESIPEFEAVIAARPTDLPAYQSLISQLLRSNKLDVAQSKVNDLKKAVGNHPLALYIQAFIDLRNGKSKEAYEGVQQVLRVAPNYPPALLLASSLQLQRRDFGQARDNLSKVLEKAPNLPLARRLLVASHLGLQEPVKALDALQPLLKDHSDDIAVLSLAGQVYAMNGDFTRSEEYFRRASAADPKNAQYRTRLGVSRLAAGETERAFQDLEAASALDTDNSQADIALIMAHLRRGESAKAMDAVKGLEKKKPNDPVTFNMKGGVFMASKDAAGARKAFERALELKPDFLPALGNLARLDISEKNPAAARKRYEDFLSKNKKIPEAYMQYGELLALTGASTKEVQAVLEKGLAELPSSLPIRVALVRMLVQLGDAKRALLLAQEAAASAPEDPVALELLGRSQVAAGELQQAIATFSKLVDKQPNSPNALLSLADLQSSVKDSTGAEQSLRKALVIKPDSIEVQQRLIAILVNTKRGEEAVHIAKNVQKQQSKSAVGFVLEGDVQFALGRKNEAVVAYGEAFQRDKSAQAAVRLYGSKVAAGQSQEASKLASDWIKANPKDLTLRSYIAESNLAAQKYDQAVQQYRQMLEIAPKNPMLLNNMAWALGKLKDKSALGVAQQAVNLAPNSPVVLDTYGTLQLENGDVGKGVETLKKAVSLGPNLPQLRLSLARALIKSGDTGGARKELDLALKNAPEKTAIRIEIDKLRASL
ncbi:MAG: PEP-CTERM system TPR-repeat protein PrsT [Proteobacteria bacterium]|nr:PEP-CTERM system TPR-repeat protein PrsT [Pseudomonadota bacterium]